MALGNKYYGSTEITVKIKCTVERYQKQMLRQPYKNHLGELHLLGNTSKDL